MSPNRFIGEGGRLVPEGTAVTSAAAETGLCDVVRREPDFVVPRLHAFLCHVI